MAAKKRATQDASRGFTEEEKAAMREAVRERMGRPRTGSGDGDADVRAKIAEMPAPDRVMAERIHALVKTHAPTLTPRTWYGMPAYSKDDQVLCWFQPASKFKARYGMLGFSDESKLDEGHVWPVSFAMTELNAADEAKIVALLKRAVG